jgi:hypothetical protein
MGTAAAKSARDSVAACTIDVFSDLVDQHHIQVQFWRITVLTASISAAIVCDGVLMRYLASR